MDYELIETQPRVRLELTGRESLLLLDCLGITSGKEGYGECHEGLENELEAAVGEAGLRDEWLSVNRAEPA